MGSPNQPEHYRSNMPLETSPQDAVTWDLPPLILHPFNERASPQSLLDNSRAALMLTGLLPADGSDEETLKSRVLAGRYTELRMLFFLGKDLFRWIDQCVESCSRPPGRGENPLQPQRLARILVSETPATVRDKLIQWGVVDYAAIFRRAIGLHCLFTEPPAAATSWAWSSSPTIIVTPTLCTALSSNPRRTSRASSPAIAASKSTLPVNTRACSNPSGAQRHRLGRRVPRPVLPSRRTRL